MFTRSVRIPKSGDGLRSDGSVVGDPIDNANVIGRLAPIRFWFTTGEFREGFAPQGRDMERPGGATRFSSWFRLRAGYSNSRSVGLIVVEPDEVANSQTMLRGGGRSAYRQSEVTGRF